MPQSANEPLETPRELGERYQRELREMVGDGEISSDLARRIRDDLFEPTAPGEPPALRWSVWCAYVEDAGRSSDKGLRKTWEIAQSKKQLVSRAAVIRAVRGGGTEAAHASPGHCIQIATLRHLHPQERREGARPGVQLARDATGDLFRLRHQPGAQRLAGTPEALRRRRLVGSDPKPSGAPGAPRCGPSGDAALRRGPVRRPPRRRAPPRT